MSTRPRVLTIGACILIASGLLPKIGAIILSIVIPKEKKNGLSINP